jgi:glycerol kinase
MVETTALGAAMLAAAGCAMHLSLGEAAQAMRGAVRHFAPAMDGEVRDARLASWRKALAAV